jgi:uncharacterized protein involved in exopolysaccharide biosynthesis
MANNPQQSSPTMQPPRRAVSIVKVQGDSTMPGETARPTVRPTVGHFLQAIWRRRVLLIAPILLMIPLSVAAALLLPKAYVARSLLLLQEDERGNPLAREAPVQASMQQRAMSLEALLKSNQVLLPIAERMPGADTAKETGREVQELRRRLSLGLVGSDFVEVELRGDKSDGLGDQLQQILGRFFEVLLGDRGLNAANIVIKRHADELKAVESERAGLQAELKKVLPEGLDAAKSRLGQVGAAEEADLKARLQKGEHLQRELEANGRDLAQKQKNYEAYMARFADQGPGRGVAILNAPGRVMVVDEPTDPAMPASASALRYIAAGMLSAVLIGIGLAWAAETLDSTIRYPEQLAALTGVPVLAHLQRAAPRSVVKADKAEARAPPRLRFPYPARAASVVFVAALVIGFVFGIAPKQSITDGYADLQSWVASKF